jgi:hypothetical protein
VREGFRVIEEGRLAAGAANVTPDFRNGTSVDETHWLRVVDGRVADLLISRMSIRY